MFYFKKTSLLQLDKMGIEIPLLDARVLSLKKHLESKGAKIINLENEGFTLEDIKPFISLDYYKKLTNDPDKEIIKAFELIDKDGNYHRYNPENQSIPLTGLLNVSLLTIESLWIASVDALKTGVSFFIGGGYHHGMPHEGRGFCLLNDIAIVSKMMIKEKKLDSVWVIDVDAHKGDGTAVMTKDDDNIQTLSIHMANGWPLDNEDKNDPSFIPSIIDIEIKEGEEDIYLSSLEKGLKELKSQYKLPGLAIVALGADPYEHDELPSTSLLKLTLDQMSKRDQLVHRFLTENKVPASYCIAGGYGNKAHEPYIEFFNYLLKNS